jgi:hypothetical protein
MKNIPHHDQNLLTTLLFFLSGGELLLFVALLNDSFIYLNWAYAAYGTLGFRIFLYLFSLKPILSVILCDLTLVRGKRKPFIFAFVLFCIGLTLAYLVHILILKAQCNEEAYNPCNGATAFPCGDQCVTEPMFSHAIFYSIGSLTVEVIIIVFLLLIE